MKPFTRATGVSLISVSLLVFTALSPAPPVRADIVGLNDAHLAVWWLHNEKPIQNPKFTHLGYQRCLP